MQRAPAATTAAVRVARCAAVPDVTAAGAALAAVYGWFSAAAAAVEKATVAKSVLSNRSSQY